MRNGTITSYDTDIGVVHTPDAQRFIFTRLDWNSSDVAPEEGMSVTFESTGLMALKVTDAEKV